MIQFLTHSYVFMANFFCSAQLLLIFAAIFPASVTAQTQCSLSYLATAASYARKCVLYKF